MADNHESETTQDKCYKDLITTSSNSIIGVIHHDRFGKTNMIVKMALALIRQTPRKTVTILTEMIRGKQVYETVIGVTVEPEKEKFYQSAGQITFTHSCGAYSTIQILTFEDVVKKRGYIPSGDIILDEGSAITKPLLDMMLPVMAIDNVKTVICFNETIVMEECGRKLLSVCNTFHGRGDNAETFLVNNKYSRTPE